MAEIKFITNSIPVKTGIHLYVAPNGAKRLIDTVFYKYIAPNGAKRLIDTVLYKYVAPNGAKD